MRRNILAGAGAIALAATAFATLPTIPAQADTSVVVVDAPDLYRSPAMGNGPRLSELSGQAVYSNSGKKIGEIEDFAIGRGGAALDVDSSSVERASARSWSPSARAACNRFQRFSRSTSWRSRSAVMALLRCLNDARFRRSGGDLSWSAMFSQVFVN